MRGSKALQEDWLHGSLTLVLLLLSGMKREEEEGKGDGVGEERGGMRIHLILALFFF